jgi:hypothetical protein
MITTRTWRPTNNSILQLEERDDGKFALTVQGYSAGFHDAATILTALSLYEASEPAVEIFLQMLKASLPARREQLVKEAYILATMLENIKEGE